MLGDGDTRDSPKRYSTKSTELRDDFIRLCWELGHKPTYNYDDGGEFNTGAWRIHYTTDEDSSNNKLSFRMHRDGSREQAENGVYCIQVEDNHTLVAGRNGKFVNIPNCYGVIGDSSSSGKGFRLFDKRIAEGITLAGRQTIEHTAKEFTEYIQENYDEDAYLLAGDTDSSVTSIPNAPDLQHVYSWSEEAVQYVDKSYDEFVKDTFNMTDDDTHNLHVELESVASALFYIMDFDADRPENTGVKKRYAQHIVWDDDDGWLDLPDADETDYDVLEDPDNKSVIAEKTTVQFEEYETGVLSDMDPTDNIGIKGFEYVRSDSATVTKESQLNVLTHILLADNPSDRIHAYLSDLRDEIYSDGFDMERLGRPKGISNPLDDYGWKTVEELENDTNYTVGPQDEERGGRYVSTPSPVYRGAKYADDHFDWEDVGQGDKPVRFYVEKVRGDEYPAAYTYTSYPKDSKRGEPPEVDRNVDAIAVNDPDRVPDQFILDKDKMVDKELKDKLQPILRTIGEDWNGLVGKGRQSGLDQW